MASTKDTMTNHNDSIRSYQALTNNEYVILPSLLACNFANLEHDIREAELAGAQALHLDIMDGHFVPNLSIGVPVVEAVRRITDLVLDVHLMLSQPERYFHTFRKAGADSLTFHVEAIADQKIQGHNFAQIGLKKDDLENHTEIIERIDSLLTEIHALGAGNGLSIIPPTDVEILRYWTNNCNNFLVMGVMPGFGGQKFDEGSLQKLSWLREHAPKNVLRSIDGGVNANTIESIRSRGATGFVMGTAIFNQSGIQNNIKNYTKALHGGTQS